jgi:mannose-6-phosphate isomerase-like protein (cupin superfamily)
VNIGLLMQDWAISAVQPMTVFSVAGDRVVILLDGEDTAQKYTVMEATLPPGGGPPPHLHHREDEVFLVLSGEVTFFVGEVRTVLRAGESLWAPRGVPHHFLNTGTEEASLLETAMPAGVERFFAAAGHPLSDRHAVPLPATAEDIARMIALAPDYGIDILRQ